MSNEQLPAVTTFLVTLTDGVAQEDGTYVNKTEVVDAHTFDFIPNGAVVFSVFEEIPGLDGPGWAKVRAFNAHEWQGIQRVPTVAASSILIS